VHPGRVSESRLSPLAGYYLLSSTVDWVALKDGIVGAAYLPSILIRVGVGLLCLIAAWRVRR